ncbi:MAG: CcdB family protein [Desulfuromonadales bacterium]
MAQYDVYSNTDPESLEIIPYLLDVQHDLHQSLASRTIVPLVRTEIFGQTMEKLCPPLSVLGETVFMSTPELAGYPVRDLGPKIATMAGERAVIISAIDFLLTGF